MFKLVIEDDDGNKTVVPVIRDEITIGRQEGNTIRLTERNVSRQHARLVRKDDGVILEEMSARYGTKKNGEKIDGRSSFGIGDVVVIGDYRLTLEGEKVEADKPNGAAPVADEASGFTNAATQITSREEIERRASQGTEILPAMPAKLVVVSSNFAGQEFPLNRKEVVIGRADECDIIVDHRSVSQTHAKIVREVSGNYKIVDLNSKNGVKVSGEEYRAVHLKRGDVVELGHVKFRFVEPGENYEFTPQSIIEDDFDVPIAGKNNTPVIIGTVVGAIVLIILALVVFGGEDGPEPATKPSQNDLAATNTKKPVESDEPKDDKVQRQIAKAKQQLTDGKPERAIADLTTARDILTPTKDERTTIDELLSRARRERPLQEALDDGRDNYNEKRFVAALKKFQEIPPEPPSDIYRIMTEEKLPSRTVAAIMRQAGAAKEEGDKEDALRLVDEILLFDADNDAAADLKAEIVAMDVKPTLVANNRPKKPKKPKKSKKPRKKSLTSVEKTDRTNEANQALQTGKFKTAISLCRPVKSGKCYRITAVAHKRLGNGDKFCKYMKLSGKTPDSCK